MDELPGENLFPDPSLEPDITGEGVAPRLPKPSASIPDFLPSTQRALYLRIRHKQQQEEEERARRQAEGSKQEREQEEGRQTPPHTHTHTLKRVQEGPAPLGSSLLASSQNPPPRHNLCCGGPAGSCWAGEAAKGQGGQEQGGGADTHRAHPHRGWLGRGLARAFMPSSCRAAVWSPQVWQWSLTKGSRVLGGVPERQPRRVTCQVVFSRRKVQEFGALECRRREN